jgi:hypothetical protein
MSEDAGRFSGCGAVGRSIGALRQFQLNCPEEVALIKLIDHAVENLSQVKEKLFSVSTGPGCSCEFCASLARKSAAPSVQDGKDPFWAWSRLNESTLIGIVDSSFIFEEAMDDPVRYLIRLMTKLIARYNLYFKEWDPDLLVRFLINYAKLCVNRPAHTAYMVWCLHKLLSGPFVYWLPHRLDLFCLFLSGLVEDLDPAEPQIDLTKERKMVRWPPEVFCDDESVMERKIDYAFAVFYEFVGEPPESPVTVYVRKTVGEILKGTRDSQQFDLFHEFANRCENPGFSAHADLIDRLLFMKSVFVFCKYSAYWSERHVMLWRLNGMDGEIGRDDMRFHFNFAKLIVRPWINLLKIFNPMKDIVGNFEENLLFFQEGCN